MRTTDEKIRTVLEMNTFWFSNRQFETTYEGYINALKENLLHLKNRVEREKLSVELISDFLDEEGKDGLTALLALTGFSYELLKRVFTLYRSLYRDFEETPKQNPCAVWTPLKLIGNS